MKKRLRTMQSKLLMVVLSALLVFLVPANVMAAEYDEKEIRLLAAIMLEQCMGTNDEVYENLKNTREAELDYALINVGIPCGGRDYVNILSSWRSGVEECGAYTGTQEFAVLVDSFTITERNGDIELNGVMEFANRSANVTFVFDGDGTVTSLTIGGQYSIPEIIKKATLNTIIGMGIVFAVLAFMAWVISWFKWINKAQEHFAKKKTKTEEKVEVVQPNIQIVTEDDDEIDEETLFAIAAVICEELERNPLRANE